MVLVANGDSDRMVPTKNSVDLAQRHIQDSLAFGNQVFAWGAGVFFFAYALFAVPCNLLLEKLGTRKILLRMMLTRDAIPPMRLDVCVAHSQGGIGYILIQALETARCFEEGVITSPRDADVGSILAFGFGTHFCLGASLARLALDAAADTRRKVQPNVRMGSLTDLDGEPAQLVREIAVQLLRNAVVHGIESPEQRAAAGKPANGKLEVLLARSDAEWTLSVRDDGCGLSAARVRQKLLELGWYTAAQLESFDDRQIVSHVFKPGFSTANAVSMHAGRGVGLDVVRRNVESLRGAIDIADTSLVRPGRRRSNVFTMTSASTWRASARRPACCGW